MIISANYKTDLPAFYGAWFINRLHAGYCKMVNSYGRQIYTIDLSPEQVDGFVFWTKNIGPFLKYLPQVQQRGYPFIIQHSINAYPIELENRVIHYKQTVEHMKQLANEYGPERLIWRYDPIIFSSLTPIDWHRRNFATLAQALQGTTDEVIISFAQVYKKTARNMDAAARASGFSWNEHKVEPETFVAQGRALAVELAQMAAAYGMRLKVCSQQQFLVAGMSEEDRCRDSDRVDLLGQRTIRDKERNVCSCEECAGLVTQDIGE